MTKFKLPKMSKVQTTKFIVFSILFVWILCTLGLLLTLIFKSDLDYTRIGDMMTIYGNITLVMNAGVIGYMAKSTYENQSKYGRTPYGQKDEPQGGADA